MNFAASFLLVAAQLSCRLPPGVNAKPFHSLIVGDDEDEGGVQSYGTYKGLCYPA